MNGIRLRIGLASLLIVAGGLLWSISVLRSRQRAAEEALSVSQRQAEKAYVTAEATRSDRPLDTFTLLDQNADQFDSSSLKGEIWIANFFFADCPSICPQVNSRLADLLRRYGRRHERGLHVVSITCDPARDTTSRLYDYARRFAADSKEWHFLTGELAYIQRVGRDIFQVSVDPQTHSSRLIVVDREGKVRGSFLSDQSTDHVALQKLLDELFAEPSDQTREAGEPTASGQTG